MYIFKEEEKEERKEIFGFLIFEKFYESFFHFPPPYFLKTLQMMTQYFFIVTKMYFLIYL